MLKNLLAAVVLAAPAYAQSPALLELQQQIGSGSAPADPTVPHGKGVVADPKKQRPKFSYDQAKIRALFNELTATSAFDQRQVLYDFPVKGGLDIEENSSVAYPVFSIHYDYRRYPIAFAFYLLGEEQIELMRSSGDSSPISTSRLIAFAAHGARFKYVSKNHPELAAAFEDEQLDGVITEPEILRLPTRDFAARAAIDWIADQYLLRTAYEQENAAKKKAWHEQKGLTPEQLALMESTYEFHAMKDLDEDGRLDLIHYWSVGDSVAQRENHFPDSRFGHKWNYLRLGGTVTDGHGEHTEGFHVKTGDGATFCQRDLIGGWWHEPFTADFGGTITFVKDPEACGLAGKTAVLIRGGGDAKAVLTHGREDAKSGRQRRMFSRMVQERVDVDAATADCLAARPDASVLSAAATKGQRRARRTIWEYGEAQKKAKGKAEPAKPADKTK